MSYLGPSVNSLTNFKDVDRRYLTNRIVNPSMQVSQENGNNAVTISGKFPIDQWCVANSGGAFSSQRVQSITSKGSFDRLRLAVTTAKTSLSSGDYLIIVQNIEGLSLTDMMFGGASAKQLLLTFGFKAPIGTYTYKIGNSSSNRSYIGQIIVSNTNDNYYQFAIPGDITGTWSYSNITGIQLMISLASGSSLVGSLGWQAGSFNAISTSTNGLSSTSNVFELFDVGLYVDREGSGEFPEWIPPSYDAELLKCQRYFRYVPVDIRGYSPGSGYHLGSSFPIVPHMRVSPTVSSFINDPDVGSGSGNLLSTLSTTSTDKKFRFFWDTTAAGLAYASDIVVSLNARM